MPFGLCQNRLCQNRLGQIPCWGSFWSEPTWSNSMLGQFLVRTDLLKFHVGAVFDQNRLAQNRLAQNRLAQNGLAQIPCWDSFCSEPTCSNSTVGQFFLASSDLSRV
ncbi:uncharacterized protein M421DRAFT_292416 [Didymella exigua CBS 183.55]|uniref:Uncharacterized protein n=1 Tax=Didymella exigua CBS 183.55 TaxID=1150837 RepID=A0A6A5RXY4_9PLEO|nr:uncharacterized protein M421DRAFT_292416 [Didymella exigua CBS 183.55]KAF1932463.1 hypothetical protein M421DRAFT_292416 [Didymella exigua CBS 183.55]